MPKRASRAREAAPEYATVSTPVPVYHLTVDERGRVMLPAGVREKLKIADGDRIGIGGIELVLRQEA
jgi:AbrB family looped-hinge helix DNA binding protein